MNKLFEMSRWGLMLLAVTGLVFIYSCGGDDEEPEPDPIEPPSGLSYPATTVAVGTEGTISPTISGDAATFEITNYGNTRDGNDVIVDVTVDSNSGDISVPMESTVGVYTIEVTATNAEGSTSGNAEITIGINDDFDPTGKKMLWKYFMNNTADVVMKNLNNLPGVDGFPDQLPIPSDGFPAGWPDQIDPTDPAFPTYFVMTGVQEALLQVPGDTECAALDPAEKGDTLIIIVDEDLKLMTQCRLEGSAGSVVEIGTSTISYVDDGFLWSINTTIEDQQTTISIKDAVIADFVDPLYPNWSNPSGQGGMYQAVQGTVEQYLTPTNFEDLSDLTKLELMFVNVSVVLEIME